METAVENGEGVLDKEATSHDDLMDAFRLSLRYRIFVNGANPAFNSALKARVNESVNYEVDIARYKSDNGPAVVTPDRLIPCSYCPLQFSKYHKHMLAHTKMTVESKGTGITINPRFNKLITSLRTAVENSEDILD